MCKNTYLKVSACVAFGSGFLALTSCSDEEEEKLKELQAVQAVEIESLEAKLAAVRTEVKMTKVDDPTPQIEELKAKVEETDGEIESLQGDILSLEKEKKNLTAEFDSYKRKYPIRVK